MYVAFQMRTAAREEISSSLARLFLASCHAVARRLQDAGLPSTIEVEHLIVERQDPRRWSTAWRAESRNVLTNGAVMLRGAPWLTRDEVVAVHRCSAMIAEDASKTLPFFMAFGGGGRLLIESAQQHQPQFLSYEHDPVGWVTRFIVLPALRRHLEALPRVERAEERAARAFAEEVLQVAHDDRLHYRVVVPLSGIDLAADPGMIAQGNICIRRLSDAEQGQLLETRGGSSAFSLIGIEPPQVVLELSVSGPRDTQYLGVGAGDHALLLVAALQLHGHQVAGHFAVETSDPVWVFPGSMQRPLTLPERSEKLSVLTASDLREVIETAGLLERYDVERPESPQDLALHRFVAGIARQNATDAVLDFTIALEALLLPYDRNTRRGDLGYRFRVHGAHYLSEQTDRDATAKQLNAIYDMRSRLVHGGKYPEQAQIILTREAACGLARRGLLRAVRQGFPTAATFNSMVLGTGTP
jgi:hypothetical protein